MKISPLSVFHLIHLLFSSLLIIFSLLSSLNLISVLCFSVLLSLSLSLLLSQSPSHYPPPIFSPESTRKLNTRTRGRFQIDWKIIYFLVFEYIFWISELKKNSRSFPSSIKSSSSTGKLEQVSEEQFLPPDEQSSPDFLQPQAFLHPVLQLQKGFWGAFEAPTVVSNFHLQALGSSFPNHLFEFADRLWKNGILPHLLFEVKIELYRVLL